MQQKNPILTSKQWEDIMQVGNDVEKDLIEGDVRLTMGGEPTCFY
jgi:uncharacterized protein (DUF2126 family)